MGKAGCRLAPMAPCAIRKHRGRNHRCGRSSGLPCAMVLTASFVLSPGTGLFCPRRLADIRRSQPGWAEAPPRHLTPASGRQDHTTSPSAPPLEKAARRAWYQSRRSIHEGGSAPVVRASPARSRACRPPCNGLCAPDAAASTASRLHVRDDRDTPLSVRRDNWIHKSDFSRSRNDLFFTRGVDTNSRTLPDGQISCVKECGKHLVL